MAMSPQQAQQMLQLGMINQDTFNRVMASQPQMSQMPVIDPAQIAAQQQMGIITNPVQQYDPSQTQETEMEKYLQQKQGIVDNLQSPLPEGALDPEKEALISGLLQPNDRMTATPEEIADYNLRRQQVGVKTDVQGQPLAPMEETRQSQTVAPSKSKSALELEQEQLEKEYSESLKTGRQAAAQEFGFLKKAQEEVGRIEADRQANALRIEEDRKRIYNEIENLTNKPPRDWWASKSTGDKALAAISIALSGIGNAFMGKGSDPNMAYKIIDDAIEKDIKMQQQDKSDKMNLYKLALQNLGDERAAHLSTYNAMMNNVQAMVGFQTKNAELKMKQQEFNQTLEKNKNEKSKILANQYETNRELIAQGYKEDPYKKLGVKDPLAERLVPGLKAIAGSKENAAKVNEHFAQVDPARKGLDKLLNLIQTGSFKALPASQLKAESDTIRASLVGALRVPLTGPGAMSEGDRKLIEDIIADPTKFFSVDRNSIIKIKTLKGSLDDSLSSYADAYGVRYEKSKLNQSPSYMTPRGK